MLINHFSKYKILERVFTNSCAIIGQYHILNKNQILQTEQNNVARFFVYDLR